MAFLEVTEGAFLREQWNIMQSREYFIAAAASYASFHYRRHYQVGSAGARKQSLCIAKW